MGEKKKWLLVTSDRWSSYTVTTVWELAWADSALVVLDEWLSYRGGRISRFDCRRERKPLKEIPDSSRLEFLEKFLANNFALSGAEDNISRPLDRGGIADLPLLRTVIAICQKS